VPEPKPYLRLAGLEPFTLDETIPFVNVGERTNVTGSAKFRKLVTNGDYAAALDVARDQVANGAQVIDINMDEGLLDSEKAMTEFCNLDRLGAGHLPRADHGRLLEVPCHRGRPEDDPGQADRQLDLDEGGRGGLPRARPHLPQYGAAVVVMAFDEKGRPTPIQRKTEICTRAYKLLTEGRLPARGHHLRSEHLRGGDGHRGARQLRRRLHRGDARSARRCRTRISRAASRTCPSPSAATRRSAKRCTRSSCTIASRSGWTWAS
jgi:hypothetical protein